MNIRLRLMILGLLFSNSILIQAAQQDNEDEIDDYDMDESGRNAWEALHRYDNELGLPTLIKDRPWNDFAEDPVDKCLCDIALAIENDGELQEVNRLLNINVPTEQHPSIGQELSRYWFNNMRRLVLLAWHNKRIDVLDLLKSDLNADYALFKACNECDWFIGKNQDEVDQHIKETHVFKFID